MRYAVVAQVIVGGILVGLSLQGITASAAVSANRPPLGAEIVDQPSAPQSPGARQASAANRFEVSSVTRNTSGEAGGGIPNPGGDVFLANNVSLEELVRWAYGVGSYRHLSPSWEPPHRWAALDLTRLAASVRNARFEIRGKAPFQPAEPESGSLGAFHYMVQALLVERFKLAARWEQRERQTYVLTLETPDPQPDPALRALVNGCLVPVSDRDRCDCGSRDGGTDPMCRVAWRSGDIGATGRGVTMTRIAQSLGAALGGEVVDRTGRTGRFDLVLRLSDGDPSLVRDALRRQFGLRLEPRTSAGEALVVLSAEMPTD